MTSAAMEPIIVTWGAKIRQASAKMLETLMIGLSCLFTFTRKSYIFWKMFFAFSPKLLPLFPLFPLFCIFISSSGFL